MEASSASFGRVSCIKFAVLKGKIIMISEVSYMIKNIKTQSYLLREAKDWDDAFGLAVKRAATYSIVLFAGILYFML